MVFTVADFIIIGFILLFAIVGFAKGFLSAILSLLNGVLALIIAYFLAPSLTEILHDTQINGFFYEKMYEWVITKGEVFSQPIPQGGITDALASQLNLPDFLINFLNNLINNNPDVQGMIFGEYIATTVTHYILIIISYIILLILARIVLAIISKLLKKLIERGGAIVFINRVLGLVFGLLKGVLIICIIFWLVSFLSSWISPLNEFIVNYINPESQDFGIARWLYNNNFIDFIINKLLNPENVPIS